MKNFQKLVYILPIVVLIIIGLFLYFFKAPIFTFFKTESREVAKEEVVEEVIKGERSELKLQEQAAQIIQTKDFSACEQISDNLYKTVCVNNVALNLAREKQDISYCKTVDDKLVPIADCESQVILAKSLDKEDIDVCKETDNQVLRKACEDVFYSSLALKKGDANICQQAQNKDISDFCYNNFLISGEFVQNAEKFDCSKFRGVDVQADCRKMKEIQGPRPDFCDTLKTNLFSSYCSSLAR